MVIRESAAGSAETPSFPAGSRGRVRCHQLCSAFSAFRTAFFIACSASSFSFSLKFLSIRTALPEKIRYCRINQLIKAFAVFSCCILLSINSAEILSGVRNKILSLILLKTHRTPPFFPNDSVYRIFLKPDHFN